MSFTYDKKEYDFAPKVTSEVFGKYLIDFALQSQSATLLNINEMIGSATCSDTLIDLELNASEEAWDFLVKFYKEYTPDLLKHAMGEWGGRNFCCIMLNTDPFFRTVLPALEKLYGPLIVRVEGITNRSEFLSEIKAHPTLFNKAKDGSPIAEEPVEKIKALDVSFKP